MMEIKLAGKSDQERWDRFVMNNPIASPYHFYAWKKAIQSSYRHKCQYFYAQKNNIIIGVLPMVHIYLPHIVNEFVSLPYCDVGGCIAEGPEAYKILQNEVISYCTNKNIKKIQLRNECELSGKSENLLKNINQNKVRMLLNLPDSSEALFSGFKSKLRSQIRKAKKNGLEFRWGKIDDINNAYTVFAKKMQELGSPVHSKRFLTEILKQYNHRAKLALVELEGNVLGMGIILLAKEGVSIPWAATNTKYNRLGTNMMVYWEILKFCADSGYKYFDFGRSTIGEGTFKFKQQWGAAPKTLLWHEFNDTESKKNKKGISGEKKDKIANIWSALPHNLANYFGPHIRKYISL